MTAAAFTSLLGYMLVCSFTPGPGNILALNTTSTYGWKRSRLLILGICLGYAIVQTGCSIALYSLNQVFEPALKILRYVGGIYMIWLAIHIFRSQPEENTMEKNPTLLERLLLQLVNVKIASLTISLINSVINVSPHIKLFLLLKMLSLYSHCIFIDTKNSTKSSKIKKTCKKSVTFSL